MVIGARHGAGRRRGAGAGHQVDPGAAAARARARGVGRGPTLQGSMARGVALQFHPQEDVRECCPDRAAARALLRRMRCSARAWWLLRRKKTVGEGWLGGCAPREGSGGRRVRAQKRAESSTTRLRSISLVREFQTGSAGAAGRGDGGWSGAALGSRPRRPLRPIRYSHIPPRHRVASRPRSRRPPVRPPEKPYQGLRA